MHPWTIDDPVEKGIEEMRAMLAELDQGYRQLEADLERLAQIHAEMLHEEGER